MTTIKYKVDEIKRLTQGESPRSKILIVGSAIDELLKKILQAKMGSCGNSDTLLDQYSPIGDFKPRIELTARLGLISSQLANDLHIVRRLRNDCAHKIENFDFNSGSTKDTIDQLYKNLGIWIKENLFPKASNPTTEEKFDMVTSVFMYYLEDTLNSVRPIRMAPIEGILYDDRSAAKSIKRDKK